MSEETKNPQYSADSIQALRGWNMYGCVRPCI